MTELTSVYNEIFTAIQQGDTQSALEILKEFAAAVLMDSEFATAVMYADVVV